MSESHPSDPMAEDPPQNGQSEGNPISADILNTLRMLQESQATPAPPPSETATISTVPATPTQPSSQESQNNVQMQDHTPPPQSEWDQLRAQLREKPVNGDGWLRLVELAEGSNDIEKIKDTYEGILETYPNTVRPTCASLLPSSLSDCYCVALCPNRIPPAFPR